MPKIDKVEISEGETTTVYVTYVDGRGICMPKSKWDALNKEQQENFLGNKA